MKTLFFKHGQEIFHEGASSKCAYIIESGSVEVSKITPEGETKILGVLGSNEIFGEMGLIDGLPRSCTVKAREDCQITELNHDTFHSLAEHRPEALVPLLRVLTNRLRATLKVVQDLEQGKIPDRSVPNPN